MARLGVALGGQRETFNGLSGIGDLVVSCISRHGRNRLVGERIGRGEKLEQVLAGIHGVPEGVLTCKAVVELAREAGVDMPISQEIHAGCSGQGPPQGGGTYAGSRGRRGPAGLRLLAPGSDGAAPGFHLSSRAPSATSRGALP
jgi:hypothetical protein